MRNRRIIAAATVATGLLTWLLLSQGAATGATAGTLTIPAPALVQLQSSTHNGGISPACGAHVDPVAGTEGQGVIQDGRGSYIGTVRLPDAATVTSLSLTAHDFTDPGDVFVYLVRKSANPQSSFTAKYNVMASVGSSGFADSARRFTTTTIKNKVVDPTSYAYFVELVNCDSTIQPTAVQVGYTTP